MKKLLPLLLPAALLVLGSCSSEPSDWRPDKKVSLDLVPPGTRVSDNYDLTPANSPQPDKGGAIPRPLNSGVKPDHIENPTPGAVMSADTQEGTAETKADQDANERKRGTEPTPNAKVGAPAADKQERQGSNQAGSPDMKNK